MRHIDSVLFPACHKCRIGWQEKTVFNGHSRVTRRKSDLIILPSAVLIYILCCFFSSVKNFRLSQLKSFVHCVTIFCELQNSVMIFSYLKPVLDFWCFIKIRKDVWKTLRLWFDSTKNQQNHLRQNCGIWWLWYYLLI